ncbi:MAG: hypothetical protein IKZ99_04280 [Salinivirgaceae bacterium]|nr:hypothetical protein [Salinivirgaceae bacterium]
MKTKNDSRNECGSRTDETPKNINPQTGAWIAEHDIVIIAANRVQYANATPYTLEAINNSNVADGYTYTAKENQDRNVHAALLMANYGITTLKSAFGMDKNAPECTENVIVVINRFDNEKFYKNCFDLAEYYNQDCFFFKAKDGEKPTDAVCVGTNMSPELGYNVKISCGAFGPKAVNEYLRRISASSFGGGLPEIDNNSQFFDGYYMTGELHFRLHGSCASMGLQNHGQRIWTNIKEHKYIYPDIQEFITREGHFRNILTFAVLANQNINTEAKGQKTLLDCVKARNYVCVPTEGRLGGYAGKLLIVINILFDDAIKIAEEYGQPAFCFANVESGVVEYWALEKENKPFNWFSNCYINKSKIADFQWPDGSAADCADEADSFKFALPTTALADVSAKIQANVDKYFKGNSAIVDWCMNRWGRDVYFRWDRLYKFD